MSRPQKIPEFHFCTKFSRRPQKIPKSVFYTLKDTTSIPITLLWKCPPPPASRLSYSFINTVTFNILLMGIFYYMGLFKAFLSFCKGSTYCKTYCGENNCILFSYPAYHVETIKTCSKIDQIIVNNNLT